MSAPVALRRQRGLSVFWVAIGSALLALAALAALFSVRYERNLFAEGAAAVKARAGASEAAQAVDSAREAVAAAAGAPDGALRRCVVKGKTIVSNSDEDCKENNPTSKKIDIVIPKGVVAPKKPVPEAPAPTSNPATDKIIEKQLQ
jgi:hypothetical protein